MKRRFEFINDVLNEHRKVLFQVGALTVCVSMLAAVMPWGLKIIIDDVLYAGKVRYLGVLVGFLLVAAVLRLFFEYYRDIRCYIFSERAVYDIRATLHGHIQRMPLKRVNEKSSGEWLSRIVADTAALKRFFVRLSADVFSSSVRIVIFFSLLCVINLRLTVVAGIFFPFFIVMYKRYLSILSEKAQCLREVSARMNEHVVELFRGMRVVKAYNAYVYEAKRFNACQEDHYAGSMHVHRVRTLLWLLAECVGTMGLIVLLYVGVTDAIDGRMTAGELVAFYTYATLLFAPIVELLGVNNAYHEACSSIDRITDILSVDAEELAHGPCAPQYCGEVSFNEVSFCYDENPILDHVSFSVASGSKVALVGFSGAGKSSVVNLLLRFYTPQSGTIAVDGYDIQLFSLESYRNRIAVVLQDDYLFSGTVWDNIFYGRDTSLLVPPAVRRSMDAIIETMPHGYDTMLGEHGLGLSGGERQRVSLMRAIAKDADLYIFDETTSALDGAVEELVGDTIFTTLKEKTCFIISHRLATVARADNVIVMQNGRIVGEGTHQSLINKNRTYMRLFESQYDIKEGCVREKC